MGIFYFIKLGFHLVFFSLKGQYVEFIGENIQSSAESE